MSKQFYATALALVFLSGCGSGGQLQSAGGLLPAHQSFGRIRQNGPAPMPSPHLLTSIDTGDVLNITPAQAAPPLIHQVFTREKAEAYLGDAAKVKKTASSS